MMSDFFISRSIESRIRDLESRIVQGSQFTLDNIEKFNLPDPIAWAEEVQGQPLDPWQRVVVSSNNPRFLLNCARQSGKSQSTSLRASYRAKYLNRSQAIIAPTLRQSSIIFRRCIRWCSYHDSDNEKTIIRSNATQIYLSNGSVIECLPGDRPDFVRGITAPDLIIDEASRIKASLIAAVTPVVSTIFDNTITMLSTPAGKIGSFFTEWMNKRIPWRRIRITADMCPRIPKSFLEEQRQRLGQALYDQEYNCKFITSSLSLLDPTALDELFNNAPDLKPKFTISNTDLFGRSEDKWTEWEKAIWRKTFETPLTL